MLKLNLSIFLNVFHVLLVKLLAHALHESRLVFLLVDLAGCELLQCLLTREHIAVKQLHLVFESVSDPLDHHLSTVPKWRVLNCESLKQTYSLK